MAMMRMLLMGCLLVQPLSGYELENRVGNQKLVHGHTDMKQDHRPGDNSFNNLFYSQCELTDCSVEDATLREVTFHDCDARSMNFAHANLDKNAMLYTTIGNGNFSGAKITNLVVAHVNAEEANFAGCTFNSCLIKDIDVTGAVFFDTHFLGCDLSGLDFSQANIQSLCIDEGTVLQDATFPSNANIALVGHDDWSHWQVLDYLYAKGARVIGQRDNEHFLAVQSSLKRKSRADIPDRYLQPVAEESDVSVVKEFSEGLRRRRPIEPASGEGSDGEGDHDEGGAGSGWSIGDWLNPLAQILCLPGAQGDD